MRPDAAFFAAIFTLSVAAAPLAAPGFSPPLDQKLLHVTTEERTDSASTERYRLERTLQFSRRDTGFAVVVRPMLAGSATGRSASLFRAGMSGLNGKFFTIRLDAQGLPTSVDEEDGVWAAFIGGIDLMAANTAAPKPGDTPGAHSIAAGLKKLPQSVRFSMLRSLLPPVVGPRVAASDIGTTRPVTIVAATPSGAPLKLMGEESYRQDASGFLVITTHAQGTLAASGTQPAAHVATDRVQRIDPRTGLIMAGKEQRKTTIGSAGSATHSTTTTSTALMLVS